MATVHYRNAKLLINGIELSPSFNELAIEYGAEILDETAFGDTTRIHKGGLLIGRITGRGFIELGTNSVEELLFGLVGVDGTPFVIFADGITEGALLGGYAGMGVLQAFNMGSAVGTILPFDMVIESRGISPT